MNKITSNEITIKNAISSVDKQLEILATQLKANGLGQIELHRIHQRADKLLDMRIVLTKELNKILVEVS